MTAHARLNRLSAIAARLPRPVRGMWFAFPGGIRFDAVETPAGLTWRTTVALDFAEKKTP